MSNDIKTGRVKGTGSAINVSIGFVPSMVEIFNLTDGDKIHVSFPAYILPFTSGGTATIAAGNSITAVGGATATVVEVVLISGTWAGGDAAGHLVVEDITGTFGSENVYLDGGSNDAGVIALVDYGVDIDTEVTATVTNASCKPYLGAASSAGKGFTIGSTISESAKFLFWRATR